MQWDKIITATLYSSVTLFLHANHLQIATTFTENQFFYWFQSNLQAQQILYSSWCIPPLRNIPNPTRTLIYLMNKPPLLFWLQLLWLNMYLTLQYKSWLIHSNIVLTNTINDLKVNKNNWLISNWRHFVSQRIPSFSMKQLPSFHKNSFNNISISINLPHPLNNSLIRRVSETELELIFNNPNWTLK